MKQPFPRPAAAPYRARNCAVKVPRVGKQKEQRAPTGSGFRQVFDASKGRVRAYVAPVQSQRSRVSTPTSSTTNSSISSISPSQLRRTETAATTATVATAAVVPTDVCKAAVGSIVHAQTCPGCLDKRCLNGRRLIGMFKTHKAKCTIQSPGACAQCSMIAQLGILVKQTRDSLQHSHSSPAPAILSEDGAISGHSTIASCA